MPIVHDPGNKPGHVIDKVWLVISTDADGEGVCAGPIPPFDLVPFIAADEARLDGVLRHAQELARMTGKTFTLIKLTQREVVGTVDRDGLHKA